jgi:hypothetical protein
MEKISSNDRRPDGGLRRVLRKRTTDCSKEMVVLSKPKVAKNNLTLLSKSISKSDKHETYKSKNRSKLPYARSEALKSKISSSKVDQRDVLESSKDIFSTVLRRSQHCCEFCDVQYDSEKEEPSSLKPFYIKPLTFGGERSVKNMVALCTNCYQRLSAHAQPSDLKQLKRTAAESSNPSRFNGNLALMVFNHYSDSMVRFIFQYLEQLSVFCSYFAGAYRAGQQLSGSTCNAFCNLRGYPPWHWKTPG